MAPLRVNRRLTADGHFQETRHLEFDVRGSGLSYEPGDALAVFPRTPEADVRALLRRLGLRPRQRLRITAAAAAAEGAGPAEVVATARAVAQGVLDASGSPPRRYLFQVLAGFAGVERERERLEYFSSPEGRDELYE